MNNGTEQKRNDVERGGRVSQGFGWCFGGGFCCFHFQFFVFIDNSWYFWLSKIH